MITDTLIWLLLASVIGGALGAHLARSQAWRGAVAAIVGNAARIGAASALATPSALILMVVGLIAMAITCGALGLRGRQIGSVVLGAILFATVADLLITRLS